MNTLFQGIFDVTGTPVIEVADFLSVLAVTLALGLLMAGIYRIKSTYSQSFVLTLILLPATVAVVIMMVNGNIGAGVAVAGAFSLVRFRSAPGSAKEIVTIFLSMGTGLIAGMGYLAFAVLFTVIMCAAFLLCNLLISKKPHRASPERTLKITVPEDLSYTDAFSDVFAEYTSACTLQRVKTVNMGSMFRLTYAITVKSGISEKDFIDRLRTRNGNLEIMLSERENATGEL